MNTLDWNHVYLTISSVVLAIMLVGVVRDCAFARRGERDALNLVPAKLVICLGMAINVYRHLFIYASWVSPYALHAAAIITVVGVLMFERQRRRGERGKGKGVTH